MNIELSRPIRITTAVTRATHPQYYVDEPYSISYRDEASRSIFSKSQGLVVTLPTDDSSDTHSIEFTIPNLETLGPGSIEVYSGGDVQNSIDITVIPSTGETSPIVINL